MQPLHSIGDLLRSVLVLIPMSVVRMLVAGILIGMIVWILSLPKTRTLPPDVSSGVRPYRWTEDLKIWAVLALAIQLAIYLCV